MSRYQLASITYRGPNRDDANTDVALVAGLVGGNGKTGPTVDLLVVPWIAIEAIRAVQPGEHATAYTKAYVAALNETIRDVCGGCPLHTETARQLGIALCYAQKNFQNAMQPTSLSRATTGDGPTRGVFDAEAWGQTLVAAGLLGVTKVRSAVAGDLGMLPERIALELLDATPEHWDWLAYTHQWHRSPWLQETHMASTQGTEKAMHAAERRGWRAFHVVPTLAAPPAGATLCPAQAGKATGDPVSCAGCPVPCDGTRSALGSTYTIDHGPGAQWRRNPAIQALIG